METKKLQVIPTLVEACQLGIKNVVPLILTVLLYAVTVWIPYLNVGTTVGLYRIIIDMSKGKTIDPLSIFKKENFENMGGFFLMLGFLTLGITAAMAFMFIPALVMGIAWGYAIYIFLDKKASPVKAMMLSDKATYGEKWTIFFIGIIFGLAAGLLCGLFGAIPYVGVVFVLLLVLCIGVIAVALEAVLYRHFSEKVDAILAEAPVHHHRPRFEEPVKEVPEAEAPAAEAPADPAPDQE